MRLQRKVAALVVAAVTATGCLDLEVMHPGAPDRARALTDVNDVEQLIAGSFRNVYNISNSVSGVAPILKTVSYQHAAMAANYGMVEFSYPGSTRIHHQASDPYYNESAQTWIWIWRAVAAVNEGLLSLNEEGMTLPTTGGEGNRAARAQAYGYFVLGLAHATAAVMYDRAYIYDPSIRQEDIQLAPYPEVMAAAQRYFDRAIEEATGVTFTIPETWMPRQLTAPQFIRLTYSYKARFRAAIARTPQERAAVDWAQVIADIDRGITETYTWNQRTTTNWTNVLASSNFRLGVWGQARYEFYGMADQSGKYQEWMSRDPWDRHPNLSSDRSSDPFLIMTPDNRFPKGNTIQEQQQAANRGRILEITTRSGGFANQWQRPDRGPFRWSYYRVHHLDAWQSPATNRHDWPEMRIEEMRLLRAEALYRMGDRAGAAAIVNQTRTLAGLNATDASGTNTSCVPKLPDGQCGDLFEMLKWEVRLETMYAGLYQAPWYFHGRGWGDLPQGTALHLPVPGREAFLIGVPAYTFGGVGNAGAAPVNTYGF
jgi:hypothetical protein